LMAEYQLYCFAQSGNAYRAALMLNFRRTGFCAHLVAVPQGFLLLGVK
jgi:hypothetical protein